MLVQLFEDVSDSPRKIQHWMCCFLAKFVIQRWLWGSVLWGTLCRKCNHLYQQNSTLESWQFRRFPRHHHARMRGECGGHLFNGLASGKRIRYLLLTYCYMSDCYLRHCLFTGFCSIVWALERGHLLMFSEMCMMVKLGRSFLPTRDSCFWRVNTIWLLL